MTSTEFAELKHAMKYGDDPRYKLLYRGPRVTGTVHDSAPKKGHGRNYQLDDLLNDIANHPARFAVRDTNPVGPHLPSAHSVNADQVDAPNAKGASAHTAKIAQVVATAMRDPGVLVELATRAASVGGNDEVWFLASVIRDRGDSAKLGALCEQFFNCGQGSAAPGAELSRGTHPTPEGGAAANTMRGEGEATERLPRAADSLEDFLPHRRNTAPSSLEGVVNAIRTKGKRA